MTSPDFTVIIPARYDSTRFPGKPLIDLAGMTMIERVYRQATASAARRVVVATDDERIKDAVKGFGGEAVMTRHDHLNGTARLDEAADIIGLVPDAVIVNVQGDEPLVPPEVIDHVAGMIRGQFRMSTLCEPITDVQDVFNPNIVKVVFDDKGSALYFSRAPIPWSRDSFGRDTPSTEEGGNWYRHLGIYGYSREMLRDFVNWPPAPVEMTEKLEQLRVLANGESIAIDVTKVAIPPGIDVPEDVERALALLEDN